MTSSSDLRQSALFNDGSWQSEHDLLLAFHSNFLSGMHGFRDNEVILQAGYDVIVISPPGGASGFFHDGFPKSNYDFLIVIHSNFLSAMHGFQDSEALLPHYDVTSFTVNIADYVYVLTLSDIMVFYCGTRWLMIYVLLIHLRCFTNNLMSYLSFER